MDSPMKVSSLLTTEPAISPLSPRANPFSTFSPNISSTSGTSTPVAPNQHRASLDPNRPPSIMMSPPSHSSHSFSQQSPDYQDYDSAYGDLPPSTSSLAPSKYIFEHCNGRTYHTFSRERDYILPNDEIERDRLDMQFWAIHEVLGEQYIFSPVGPHPQNILDVGTGTGTWAIDVGDMFPSATVTGTDLSPIQPKWVPPNVCFELHDCIHYPWEFRKQFDLIHTQSMAGLAIKNWDEFYEEAARNLLPGGWVESHEYDYMVFTDHNSLPNPCNIIRWLNEMEKGAGGGFRISAQRLVDAMTRAGLVNVHVRQFKLPVGPWDPKQRNAGMLMLTTLTEHIEGISQRVYMERMGLSKEQMRERTEPVVMEWRKKGLKSYFPLFVVCGQKPPLDRYRWGSQ